MKQPMNKAVYAITTLLGALWLLLTLAGCSGSNKPSETDTPETETENPATGYAMDEYVSDLRFIMSGRETSVSTSCWYSADDKIYYIFLPSFSDIASTVLSCSNGAEIGGKYYAAGTALGDLEKNKEYAIACFGTDGGYTESASIVFMQSANIPAMFIETKSGSIDEILADKFYKEAAVMTLVTAAGETEYDGGLEYIKGRGNYTWLLDKRPFNIKLDKSTDLLGMGKAKRWCLIANYMDQSNIRNKLAYDLAKAAGLQYSQDSKFIDLYLNGEYYGLFLLTEKVEVDNKRVDINDLESATKAINSEELKTYGSYSTDSYRCSLIENDPEDISGGYLIQVEYNYRLDDEASYFMMDDVNFIIASPEYASKAQTEYISGLTQEMKDAILDNDSSEYLKFIDLESWVKVYLVEEILENSDFMRSSQYFYKNVDIEGETSPIFAGPVWDFDVTMGNMGEETSNPSTLFAAHYTWFYNLYYHHTEFYERAVQEYENTFLPLMQKLVETGIAEYEAEIEVSCNMNYVRWPLPDSKTGWDTLMLGSLHENMEQIRSYLSEREEFLTDLWINGVSFWDVYATTESYINGFEGVNYMVKDGEAIGDLKTQEIKGYVFDGWHYTSGESYDPDAPVTENFILYARYTMISELGDEQIEALGYDLDTCTDIYVYLRLLGLNDDYTIFIVAKDEAAMSLNDELKDELAMLGLDADFSAVIGGSYIAVIEDGKVTHEETSLTKGLEFSGVLSDGTDYTLKSAGFWIGNYADIIVRDEELAVQSRGLNIVVIDNATGDVIDSVCFDTYLDLTASR
jgi:hypothetical protein